ncbi:glycoside hydrolase superfamily, partial [Aspergillus aurantiobrunneus]
MKPTLFATLPPALAWLPPTKIRGVNLGSHFIIEPWMASSAWDAINCSDQNSKFDCVLSLGQNAADSAFSTHWSSWITQDDIAHMRAYGLNTVRIPVGYWVMEELVDESDHFPRGGLQYLEEVCGWASEAGLYIIVDLHGSPGRRRLSNRLRG